MLRLTLLSSTDAALVARVVDPGAQPFVLDFGDREVIASIRHKLQHGFTTLRDGERRTVASNAENLLACLASHCAEEGLLVFYEEPTWLGRQIIDPSTEDLEDEDTELVDVDDLPDVGSLMQTVYPQDELGDPPTPGPAVPRPPPVHEGDFEADVPTEQEPVGPETAGLQDVPPADWTSTRTPPGRGGRSGS